MKLDKKYFEWFKSFCLNKNGKYSKKEFIINWILISMIVFIIVSLSLVFIYSKKMLIIIMSINISLLFTTQLILKERLEKNREQEIDKLKNNLKNNSSWLIIKNKSQKELFKIARKLNLISIFANKKIPKNKLTKIIFEYLYEK